MNVPVDTAERSPYASLLGVPAIRQQALFGVCAQITQGAAGLGIILIVRQATGSLALAGATSAAFAVGAGIARPIQGRLIDRRGASGVLAASGALHAGALIALVVLAGARAPGSTYVALALLAGVGLPPVSASMRLAWAPLSADGDLTSAYSIVTLTQELTILLGPLLLAALIAVRSARLALAAIAALAGVGTLLFAGSVRTAPGSTPVGPPATAGILRSRAVRLVWIVTALVGTAIGALGVAAAALATSHHRAAASGLLVAALSIGGLVGGTVYGARRWGTGVATRLIVVLAALTLAVVPLIATNDLVLAGALMLVAGLAINPTLTTTALLVDRHAPARAAEAFGWLSTAIATGTGAGSALGGAVAGSTGGAAGAFVVAAIASGLAAVVAGASRALLEGR